MVETLAERDQLAAEVEELVRSYKIQDRKIKTPSLYYAYAAGAILTKHGYSAGFSAGTAVWPRIRKDQDDGKCTTHWGYEYDPFSKDSERLWRARLLPVMHCWTVIVDREEGVDFTVGQQTLECQMKLGKSCIKLPRIFWGSNEDAKRLWYRYVPSPSAIQCAVEALAREGFGVAMRI